MGGCSFLEHPNILTNTELANHFGPDAEVINAATGGSNNDAIFKKAFFSLLRNDFDFVLIGWTQVWRISKVLDIYHPSDEYKKILTAESYESILKTTEYYTQVVANDRTGNRFSHFEPEGTDNCIMYPIILHQLMKQRGIPHLFISMGDIIPYTLNARPGWLEFIDTKNYFGTGELKDKIKPNDIDMKRNNLFYLLKDSIVGGPSIIFTRYHEANKTKINVCLMLAPITRIDRMSYGLIQKVKNNDTLF